MGPTSAGSVVTRSFVQRSPADIWIFVATVLITQLLGTGVLLYSTDFAWAILAVQTLLGACAVRYGFRRHTEGFTGRFPVLLFLAPLVSTVLGIWWIVPALTEPEVPPVMAVVLWALISVTAALFSILVAFFIVLPLELLGRALIAATQQKGKQAMWMVPVAFYILVVPAMSIAGAVALEDLPGPPRGSYAAFAALLGVEGNYTVRNEGALWVTRILFLVLVVPLLGAARIRRDRQRDPQGPQRPLPY
jgi:hypothetical protein